MVKEDKIKILNKQKEIINKINNKWIELQNDFYICYSVKELAYKVVYDLLNEYIKDYNKDIQIYYKLYNNKHKIMFYIENNIYMGFDIYWVTGMFGDSGLKIGNGQITNELRKGYNDIEEVLRDEE